MKDKNNSEKIRLQKFIADSGYTSRRKAEELIVSGCVKVNGVPIAQLGSKIDPKKDLVTINGQRISAPEQDIYIMLHKPVGIVTTLKDEKNRPIVTDLIHGLSERVFPIGRLDMDSSGLLLLTNDGHLANLMSHPRYGVSKEYIVTIQSSLLESQLNLLKNGILIDGKKTQPATVIPFRNTKSTSSYRVIIKEGRNRQIRKMFASVGHTVIGLHRIAYGEIKLGDLNVGNWRFLKENEIQYIRSLCSRNSF